MAALPNFTSLEVKLKRVFGVCSLLCAVSTGTIILLQLAIDEQNRVELCAALFVALGFICILIIAVLGVGGHKVRFYSVHCASIFLVFIAICRHASFASPSAVLLFFCWQLLALIDQSQSRTASSMHSQEPQAQNRSLAKLRRKLLLMIVAIEGLAANIFLSCLGLLLIPALRDRTWLVMPVILSGGILGGHVALFFTPAFSSRTANSPPNSRIGSVQRSSGSPFSLGRPSMMPAFKVSPATNGLLDPVAILACSQLVLAKSIRNKDEFRPPQEQPRAEKLIWVAGLLQDAMFKKGERTMNETVAGVIKEHFIPVAQVHFAECVEQARDMIPEMQDRYHDLRKGHLAIYQDTLDQIRGENAFAELQKRSDKLVGDCKKLSRRKEQKATSVCDLFNGAEAVSARYDALMASIASKTGTKFHSAPRKGLVRICEKLALASKWQPEHIFDVTRGLCSYQPQPNCHTTSPLCPSLPIHLDPKPI
jgi:hypothetical protein